MVTQSPVRPSPTTSPYRTVFTVAEAVMAASALLGTGMLLTDTAVPDVTALEPLGLHSWTLPGLWLFASVAAPSGLAAFAAARRHPRTPDAVLVASALLVVELLVQMPFLGFDPLQPIMGVPALALAALARRARAAGWRPTTQRPTTPTCSRSTAPGRG